MLPCNTENCKYCRDKYLCPDYTRYLENIVLSPVSNNSASYDNQFSEIASQINALKQQNEEINNKLDCIISKFESYENVEVMPSDTNLAVYNANQQDTVLVEKKGFLGLGKPKWVEEKI